MIQEILDKIQQINETRFTEMNGRQIISVSKLENYVTEPFDSAAQAKKCAEKGRLDPNYKYAGKTDEEILKLWEDKAAESRLYGSLLDEYAEQKFMKDENSVELWKLDHNYDYDSRLKGNCTGFEQFVADMAPYGYEFVGREITVYLQTPSTVGEMPFDNHEEEGNNVVTGRIDCLFYNRTSERFLIVDWKTTDEIRTTAFKHNRMKGPLMKAEDCDMGKYTIQLHMYKTALCQTYGLATPDKVSVCIVNLRREPDKATNKNYLLYKENFEYDARVINQTVDFAIKKRTLMKGIS